MKDRRVFWYVPAFLFFLTFVFPFQINGYINPHDDGVWIAAVQALLEGKRLYRDIWLQYNPILPWISAQVLSMTSPTLAALRSTFWVLNALGLACVSAAVFHFVDDEPTRFLSLLWLWLVPASAPFRCIPMAARYGPSFLPFIAWPKASDETAESLSRSACIAGALAAVAFWVEQDMGVAALVAGMILFGGRRDKGRALVRYLGSAGVILGIGALVITLRDGFFNYIQSAVIQTAQLVRAEKLPFPSLGFLLHPALFRWQSLADALAVYLPMWTYGAVLLWSIFGTSRWQGARRTAAALAVFGILAASSAWGRTDRWHIYLSVSPMLLLWGYLVQLIRREHPERGTGWLWLFMIGSGLITLPHYFAWEAHAQRLKPIQRRSPLPRMGRLRLPYWQANAYEALVMQIQKRTQPGEPIVFFPYDGAIYFLADRPNPCRLPILAYAVRPEMQDEAIQEIERARVRWVILDTENTTFDGVPIDQFLSRISAYLHTHYQLRDPLGPFRFLERK